MDQDQTWSSYALDLLPGNGSTEIRKNRGSAEKQMVKCVQILRINCIFAAKQSNPLDPEQAKLFPDIWKRLLNLKMVF
jgi:hypothetical protein